VIAPKRKAALALLCLTLAQFITIARAEDSIPGCSIRELISVKNLGPHRRQGNSGFCYGFTATRAIEQFVCRLKQSPCSNDSERLSVLDVIRKDDGYIQEGGDTNALLISFGRETRAVAKESCAPFDVLKLDESRDRLEGILREFDELKNENKTDAADPCPHAKEVAKLLNWNNVSSIAEIMLGALPQHKSERIFLAKLLVPPKCSADPIQVPPLKVGRLLANEPLTKKRIHDTLIANSRNNIPTIWNYCNKKAIDGACEEGHSVLITGARQVCCPGILFQRCKWQYQISDSLQPNGDNWLDEAEVTERSLYLATKTNINPSTIGMPLDERFFYYTFQWLE
jgi:hypothetical protein